MLWVVVVVDGEDDDVELVEVEEDEAAGPDDLEEVDFVEDVVPGVMEDEEELVEQLDSE